MTAWKQMPGGVKACVSWSTLTLLVPSYSYHNSVSVVTQARRPTAPSTTLRNILIQVVEGIPSGSGWENLFTAVIRIPHLGEQV